VSINPVPIDAGLRERIFVSAAAASSGGGVGGGGDGGGGVGGDDDATLLSGPLRVGEVAGLARGSGEGRRSIVRVWLLTDPKGGGGRKGVDIDLCATVPGTVQ
jgi:hypothetical protein